MRVFRLRISRSCLLLISLLLVGASLGRSIWRDVNNDLQAMAPALFGQVILIDAGHGDYDPGVMGISGAREADINLAIAKKLEEYCRQGGMTVLMTRSSDAALADRKKEDMRRRVELAETADIFVSLHCNSYIGSSKQHGAQVFYQKGNEAGQLLAEAVQTRLKEELGNTDRVALAHPDSYLLKNIDAPAIIAEMGFLSNQEEEALLQNESYQWQVAWSIYQALNDFFLMDEPEKPNELEGTKRRKGAEGPEERAILEKSMIQEENAILEESAMQE